MPLNDHTHFRNLAVFAAVFAARVLQSVWPFLEYYTLTG